MVFTNSFIIKILHIKKLAVKLLLIPQAFFFYFTALSKALRFSPFGRVRITMLWLPAI